MPGKRGRSSGTSSSRHHAAHAASEEAHKWLNKTVPAYRVYKSITGLVHDVVNDPVGAALKHGHGAATWVAQHGPLYARNALATGEFNRTHPAATYVPSYQGY